MLQRDRRRGCQGARRRACGPREAHTGRPQSAHGGCTASQGPQNGRGHHQNADALSHVRPFYGPYQMPYSTLIALYGPKHPDFAKLISECQAGDGGTAGGRHSIHTIFGRCTARSPPWTRVGDSGRTNASAFSNFAIDRWRWMSPELLAFLRNVQPSAHPNRRVCRGPNALYQPGPAAISAFVHHAGWQSGTDGVGRSIRPPLSSPYPPRLESLCSRLTAFRHPASVSRQGNRHRQRFLPPHRPVRPGRGDAGIGKPGSNPDSAIFWPNARP